MDQEEYRQRGKEMVDYIFQYLTTLRERRVSPDVKPGYMRGQLPHRAPLESESWDNIFQDIEKIIMPGVVHWQSPHMHAYFPALTSWPSLLGDMLADAINCLGFTWASSPTCTELEMNVMDWLAQMLDLPDMFLHYHPDSRGGGILQSTVSESTLVALLAARKNKILEMKTLEPDTDESTLNSRLVAYASDQAHSSVEKAGLISLVKVRFLPVDENFSLRGETLREAIEKDRSRGLVPFFVCATLGTTGVCAFDNLEELGPICTKEGLWLHIDAAYAGTAFLCPEFRPFLKGVEHSDSFTFNPSKWMMVHFDCTAFWVKDKCKLQQTFSVNPIYLRHPNSGSATDFMHWQIPLSRRFRSLKLWFVIRSFGVKKLQAHVRHGTEMAKYFESLVRSDPLFEIPAKRHLGLVVFRLKGPNWMTEKVLKDLNKSGSLFLIPAVIQDKFIIRFTVTSQFTTQKDILRDWSLIQRAAVQVFDLCRTPKPVTSEEVPGAISSPSPKPTGVTSHFFLEKGERRMSSPRRVTAQPRRASLGSAGWLSTEHARVPGEPPLEDTFVEDGLNTTSLSNLPAHKKKTRSLSVPTAGLWEPSCSKVASFEGSGKSAFNTTEKFLSKLPEEVLMLEKSAFKKFLKFYRVPSFPECTVQCGLQLPCCPLQATV
ncbi:PREDICTED: histidine decarboxylase isoform X1 [Gekko japonicus]|uniref:Histidine decarboxylase n=1 Tax=Gekko japonicus TaxID=146911 RepID=A0ABM1L5V3_GEKJA|nr:PREDICTED: histidine decarboxylase isoform X1 [Gekko japonicus]